MSKLCFQCGNLMVLMDVAPCIICGGNPKEIDDFNRSVHSYYQEPVFGNNILCDFDDEDVTSTDPQMWGFSKEFNWENDHVEGKEISLNQLSINKGYACPVCYNTEFRQNFIVQNSIANKVTVPLKYYSPKK